MTAEGEENIEETEGDEQAVMLSPGDAGDYNPRAIGSQFVPCCGSTMKTKLWVAAAFTIGIVMGQLTISPAYGQFRTTKSERLLTTHLAGWCDGKEVTVELNEAGPGTSGKHYHPGHSFTDVIDGSETYVVERQPAQILKAGDVLHEAPMQLHTVDNQSAVKLLIRVIDKGKNATVRVP
jgi:quercetin dioxygenase-like cupin family protein